MLLKTITKTLLYLLYLLIVLIIAVEAIVYFTPMLKPFRDLMFNIDHRMQANQTGEINNDGIRSYKNPEDIKQEDTNVIFLGDSFTFGSWLHYPDNIPSQFETIAQTNGFPHVKAWNFGWVTSSPLLSLRLLKDIGHKYQPDTVILLVDMTDFIDDLKYRNALQKDKLWALREILPGTTLLLASQIIPALSSHNNAIDKALLGAPHHTYVVEQPIENTESIFEHTKSIIDEINTYSTNKLNAKFYMVLLPRKFQFYPADQTFIKKIIDMSSPGPHSLNPFIFFDRMAPQLDYPYWPLLEDFNGLTDEATFEDDPHYNAFGANIAARAIFNRCLQNNSCFNQAATQ